MESDNTTTKIEKLNHNNYHSWKQKIELLLALKDLDQHISSPRPKDESEALAWDKNDRKTRAIIGLTLSDQILENVRHVNTSTEMWMEIQNVFEQHTLRNKLAARRRFFTVTKSEGETILEFCNRIRQLASTLKSMNVTVQDCDMAMALLCGLPEQFDPLISALDAIGSEENELEFDHVKSRVLQEELRIGIRIAQATSKSETNALVSNHENNCVNCNIGNSSRPKCNHCGILGHVIEKCWKKYPHLNPHKNKKKTEHHSALMANHGDQKDIEDVICLIGKHVKNQHTNIKNPWYIDSGCSNHMTFDRSLFTTLDESTLSTVELGNRNRSNIIGCGSIDTKISVNGKTVPCTLKNVLLIPELGYQLLSVSSLSKGGLSTTFSNGRCWIKRENTLVASGTLQDTLYKLDTPKSSENIPSALISASLQVWHERFAHVDPSIIKNIIENNTVHGASINNMSFDNLKCNGCILGKGHRNVIPKTSTTQSSHLLELIHSDINGPLETPSIGGSRYFITFIDDYSKWTAVYTMKHKSESLKYFKEYSKYAQVHIGKKVGYGQYNPKRERQWYPNQANSH